MVIFLIFYAKICSKYTPKRTKLHHLKKFSRGNMLRNPPSNAQFCTWLRNMQISKSEKKILAPPPAKSWLRP